MQFNTHSMLPGMLLNDIHEPRFKILIILTYKNYHDVVPTNSKIRNPWQIVLPYGRQMAGKSYYALAQPTNVMIYAHNPHTLGHSSYMTPRLLSWMTCCVRDCVTLHAEIFEMRKRLSFFFLAKSR